MGDLYAIATLPRTAGHLDRLRGRTLGPPPRDPRRSPIRAGRADDTMLGCHTRQSADLSRHTTESSLNQGGAELLSGQLADENDEVEYIENGEIRSRMG